MVLSCTCWLGIGVLHRRGGWCCLLRDLWNPHLKRWFLKELSRSRIEHEELLDVTSILNTSFRDRQFYQSCFTTNEDFSDAKFLSITRRVGFARHFQHKYWYWYWYGYDYDGTEYFTNTMEMANKIWYHTKSVEKEAENF